MTFVKGFGRMASLKEVTALRTAAAGRRHQRSYQRIRKQFNQKPTSPQPEVDRLTRFIPSTNSASYEKVSTMLGYPYCGIASMALGSTAAEAGVDSTLIRGVYRAGNEDGEEQPHAWVRLRTYYGMVSVDLTHGQFGELGAIISLRPEQETSYGLYARFEMPIQAGDFEAMLELATRGGNWDRFLPLKEYSLEFLVQLTSALHPPIRLELHSQIKSAVPFHGKTRLLTLDELMGSDMFRNLPPLVTTEWGRHNSMLPYTLPAMNGYRVPADSHFVRNKSPGWLRS